MTDDEDRYLPLDDLVLYTGLSRRQLERYMSRDEYPLPHFKVGRRILVRKSDFDTWIRREGTTLDQAKARHRERTIDDRVKDAVAGLRSKD